MEVEGSGFTEEKEQLVPRKPPRFFTAIQLFAVPAGIVAICVGIYLLFTFLSYDPRTASDILDGMKTSYGHSRNVLMHDFGNKVLANQDILSKDEIFITKVINVAQSISGNNEDDIALKCLLLQTLGILRAKSSTKYLVDVLNSKEIVIKVSCLDALGAIKDPNTSDDVSRLLNDEEFILRYTAAYNLGAIVSNLSPADSVRTLAVERLKQKLDDKSDWVSWHAAIALARFLRESAGAPVLRKMLDRKYLYEVSKDERDIIRFLKYAIAALAVIKDKTALDKLNQIARDDQDWEVRQHAHNAIAEINK